jgi:hypothetical protein
MMKLLRNFVALVVTLLTFPLWAPVAFVWGMIMTPRNGSDEDSNYHNWD